MLEHELWRELGILIVTPKGALEAQDFERLAREVDPYLTEAGKLRGLMIYAESFPGWTDFAALVSHIRFTKDHQHRIARIAAVTDSGFLSILPKIANHFVKADVRHFPYDQKQAALEWLQQPGP